MSWPAMRALLRVEFRHVARHPWRSLLIALLVAIPTAAMVGGSGILFTARMTIEDQRHEAMGRANLGIPDADSCGIEDADDVLPPQTEHVWLAQGIAVIERPGLRVRAQHFCTDATSLGPGGMLGTRLRLAANETAPRGADEVALTRRMMRVLAVDVGDRVELNGQDATVTGELIVPANLSSPSVLTSPALPPRQAKRSLFVQTDDAEGLARELEARGASPILRTDVGSSDPFEEVVVFVCGTFGFFEAALVIGAAFAVGMRRRQREIGLIASNGADVGPIVRAVLTSTALLAAVGAALGVAAGWAAAAALYPLLDGWTQREVGPLYVPLVQVGLAVLLGIGTATLSAWIPTRTQTRLPVHVALSGQRPPKPGSGRFLTAGAVLVALGTAAVIAGVLLRNQALGMAILAGAIFVVLGLGTASPWILERIAAGASALPLVWRLAVRDAGRFRARNGPVVTAVLAGMSISVLMGAMAASVERIRAQRPSLAPNEIRIRGVNAERVGHALVDDFGGRLVVTDESNERIAALDVEVNEAVARAAAQAAAAYDNAFVSATALDPRPETDIFRGVLIVTIVTGLIVIFVATSLTAIESSADVRTLHTVGASPRVLRHHLACRAAYLAVLGCVLAIPAGLVPIIGLLRLSNGMLEFAMPWSTVAIAIFVMPGIAYAGTLAYASIRPPALA